MLNKFRKGQPKIVPQLNDLEYIDRLKELNISTLAHRRRRGDMIQTFKIIRGIEDIPSDRFFTICHSMTRGHEYKLAKPRCTTSFRLQQFSQRIINDWNSLPKYHGCERQRCKWFQIKDRPVLEPRYYIPI